MQFFAWLNDLSAHVRPGKYSRSILGLLIFIGNYHGMGSPAVAAPPQKKQTTKSTTAQKSSARSNYRVIAGNPNTAQTAANRSSSAQVSTQTASKTTRTSVETSAKSNPPSVPTTSPTALSASSVAGASRLSDLDKGWLSISEWKTEDALRYFARAEQQAKAQPKAPGTYRIDWGYGTAYGQLGRFAESVSRFEKAVEKYPNDARLICDFGFTYMSWAIFTARTGKSAQDQYDASRYFDAAEAKFIEAHQLAPKESLPYSRLAMLAYYRGNYPMAWNYVKRSRALGGEDLDSRFLKDLAAKLPEK